MSHGKYARLKVILEEKFPFPSTLSAEGPRITPYPSYTSDLKAGTLVATLPDICNYRVSYCCLYDVSWKNCPDFSVHVFR